jgi:hypothetical protein
VSARRLAAAAAAALEASSLAVIAHRDHRHADALVDHQRDAVVDGRGLGLARRAPRRRQVVEQRRPVIAHQPVPAGDDRVVELGDDVRDLLGGDAVALVEQPVGDAVAELARALPALLDRLLERLADDVGEAGLEVGAVLLEPRQLGVAHHQQHVELVGGGEQPAPGQHLGEDDADREQVGALIEGLLDDLLGRHVTVLALERAGLALVGALRIERPGDAEIDQLDVAAHRQQHVGGRDVAVDDAERLARLVGEAVGVVERVEDLVDDPRRELRLDPAVPDRVLAEQREDVDAVDVLHRDEELIVDLAELEGLGDLGMDEPRGELGLVDEHRVVGLVVDELRQQPLDHDALLEPVLARRGRDEQLRHPAEREALDELVASKRDREGLAHVRGTVSHEARHHPAGGPPSAGTT